MSNVKKLMMTAAGAGGGLNVEDVFSTYLYTGTSSAQTITNGIDLAGEGGLVWTKNRDTTGYYHNWIDTERGISNWLRSDSTNGNISTFNNAITSFNFDGYSLGTDTYAYVNNNNKKYVSWTFRKAPKFFDVVTYTGNGTAGREISHNLGTTVGTIIVKRLNAGTNWGIYHRSNTSSPEGQVLEFDTGATTSNTTIWNNTAPTSTVFTVGNSPYSNFNGSTYVAYLFAHNNGDGDFGPTGDQDIIKCGSYTYSNGLEIDLGFEPQWLLYKQSSTTGSWRIVDNMRGWGVPSTEKFLYPNLSNAEAAGGQIDLTSTGFKVHDAGTGDYIYIAIRRGPMAVPESATDVFEAAYQNSVGTSPGWTSGFPVDMSIDKNIGGGSTDEWAVGSRLTQGKYFYQIATSNEGTWSAMAYDFMDGWRETANNGPSDFSWMWRRAPNFFDVVAYDGNSTAGRTVSHNLGVAPEMMWVKKRSGSDPWAVYHTGIGENAFGIIEYLRLNESGGVGFASPNVIWNDTDPTDSVFTLGLGGLVNESGATYIAYLFASLDGVSKVGSYTGNGTNQNIDCGFSNGARFVLVKPTNTTGNWQLAGDFGNGIVAGSDSLLRLDLTNAVVNFDFIDPYSGGFNVTGAQLNTSGTDYIFYAIA